MYDTLPLLASTKFPAIARRSLDVLQINLGYRCNQRCLHCHVNAGPTRTEVMNDDILDLVLSVVEKRSITTVDLTGGAPELNPGFRSLVTALRDLNVKVIDRCNLTVLSEPDQRGLAEFLAENQVEVVASMPCYSLENVDRQRGDGVFERSISGLQQLNALGYGMPESGLILNLVYNPQGPTLPPNEKQLEQDYKRELHRAFGVYFNHLFTITNMPIKRFGSQLVSSGQFASYQQLLLDAYRAENLGTLMCRSQLSVDWQGYLYDCDFNQMLAMPAQLNGSLKPHLRDLLQYSPLNTPIAVAGHCYGCTAGQGSSCGGALDPAM